MIDRLYNSILNNYNNNAFLFHQEFFTYKQVEQRIIAIQQSLINKQENTFGVFTHYHIDTYASLLAIWLLGKTAVPIPLESETNSINQILSISGIKTILSAFPIEKEIEAEVIDSKSLNSNNKSLLKSPEIEENIMYIIFSDDNVNTLKGIPITFKNLNTYIKSFLLLGINFNENEKVIQPFELTFDASLDCYLIPLLFGACVYPLENTPVKYLQSIKLINDNQITFAKYTPAMIASLKPWFRKINLPSIKNFIFSCEPLELNLCNQWKSCVPNAQLYNLNGRQATVECFSYKIPKNEIEIKSFQNLVCMGKPMGETNAIIVNSNKNELSENQIGQISMSGNQIFNHYIYPSNLNEISFFHLSNKKYFNWNENGFKDIDGDIFLSLKTSHNE